MLDDRMAEAAALGAGLDWKTSLQELGARTGAGVPVYEVHASGPDHSKYFHAIVRGGPDISGEGSGASKKHAEQVAAAAAYATLSAARPDLAD
jgi:ribonuclease-3